MIQPPLQYCMSSTSISHLWFSYAVKDIWQVHSSHLNQRLQVKYFDISLQLMQKVLMLAVFPDVSSFCHPLWCKTYSILVLFSKILELKGKTEKQMSYGTVKYTTTYFWCWMCEDGWLPFFPLIVEESCKSGPEMGGSQPVPPHPRPHGCTVAATLLLPHTLTLHRPHDSPGHTRVSLQQDRNIPLWIMPAGMFHVPSS